ncbi:MAG: hypothetical protein IT372_03435 [Polyangiaceae bacterium]|nr:hypothetical protein [Polyangiaceae bacterium]
MRSRLASVAVTSSLFAVVAGSAGWLYRALFTNPALDFGSGGRPAVTAGCAAAAGAVAGVLLAPSDAGAAGDGDAGRAPRPSPALGAGVVLAAGAAVGGVDVALHAPEDAALGAVVGVLCAIPLIPAAALAIAILRRAGRARRGSVVARADARALVGTAAGILGATPGLAVLDWPAAAAGDAVPPRGPVVLLVAAAAFVALALVVDLMALRRVERWALELAAPGDPPAPGALPAGRIDMGVGDGVVSAAAPGTAYRGGGRAIAVVLGDVDDAVAALRQSIRRGVFTLAVLEVIGIGHGLARGPDVAAHYSAWLCDEGRPAACRSAALLAERAGWEATEAAELHGRACGERDERSCFALELMRRMAQ